MSFKSLGSSSFVINELHQKVLQISDYYAFGQKRTFENLDNSSLKNRKQFTGKEQDEGTNLYYFGARYYDSEIGRFVSVDPVVINPSLWLMIDPQSLNAYTYARNNPIKFVDRDGKVAETVWDGANVIADFGAVVYEAGQALGDGIIYTYGVVSGDENYVQAAKDGFEETTKNWNEVGQDLAVDAAATMIPFVPAGGTKINRVVNKIDNAIDASKNAKKVEKELKLVGKHGPDTIKRFQNSYAWLSTQGIEITQHGLGGLYQLQDTKNLPITGQDIVDIYYNGKKYLDNKHGNYIKVKGKYTITFARDNPNLVINVLDNSEEWAQRSLANGRLSPSN